MGGPVASLSLDLDNHWSYLKTHGDPAWQSLPSYLDIVVPRVLSFLAERSLRITVFVVGQDAALDRNREPLQAIAAAGHEIANHSFRHEPWLHRYSDTEVDDELSRAHEAIEQATGQAPVGFRGPGYSLSEATLQTLARRGYAYDATTLPTFIGPLARAYYFRTSKLDAAALEQREALFGSWRDGLRPVRPYEWDLGPSARLLELPVTTMPVLRVPIHFSYLLYLSAVSPALARRYFATSLWLCRRTGVRPSLLLHPLDFLDSSDAEGLSFFPGAGIPHQVKLERVGSYVDALRAHFTVGPVLDHVRDVRSGSQRSMRRPRTMFHTADSDAAFTRQK